MGRTHLVVAGVVVLTEGDSVCRDEEMLKFIRDGVARDLGPEHAERWRSWTGDGIREVVRRARGRRTDG